MAKCLVTGGAGFVGRHLVRALLERGDSVVCVDPIAPLSGGIDPNTGWPLFDPRGFDAFEYRKEDCRVFFQANKNSSFDYAFHLAAIVGGREVIENNPLAVAEDLSIDAAFWNWAASAKPGKVANFSSSAAYPIRLQTKDNFRLLTEDLIDFNGDLGLPDLSYGWAKLTCEFLARLAYQKHGIRSATYRPFSGYGEDQDQNYPFPGIIRRVLGTKDKTTLKVWGSGHQKRDFIHIDDCVKGILLTIDKIQDASAVNLSTGLYTSMIEFAQIAAECAGLSLQVEGMSDKPEGVFARGGDTRRQKELGFEASLSFKDGVKRGVEYLSRLDPPKAP